MAPEKPDTHPQNIRLSDRIKDKVNLLCAYLRSLSWLRPPSSFEEVRKLLVNCLIVGLSTLTLLVFGNAVFKDVYVVKPIAIPQNLKDLNYTGDIITQQILDEVAKIYRETKGTLDDNEQYSTSTPVSELLKANLPDSSISLESIVSALRQFFHAKDTEISGEIILETPPEPEEGKATKIRAPKFSLRLRLRITDKGLIESETGSIENPTEMFESAALQIVERFEPYRAALYYERHQRYEDALRLINVCLTSDDRRNDMLALNLRATVAYDQQRYQYAIQEYKRIIDSHRAFFPLAWYNLSITYRTLGDIANRNGHSDGEAYSTAEKYYEKAERTAINGTAIDSNKHTLAIGYDDVGGALEQLLNLKGIKDKTPALRFYEKSALSDPGNYRAYLNEQRILRDPNDPDISVDLFRLAAAAHPSDDTVYQDWARFDLAVGRNDEAAAVLKKAIEVDRNDANNYNLRGLVELATQNWDSAAEDFLRATNIRNDVVVYHYNLGRAFLGAKKIDDAIKALRDAIKVDPTYVSARTLLGQAIALSGKDNSAAIDELEKARHLAPNDSAVIKEILKGYEIIYGKKDGPSINRVGVEADQSEGLDFRNSKSKDPAGTSGAQ